VEYACENDRPLRSFSDYNAQRLSHEVAANLEVSVSSKHADYHVEIMRLFLEHGARVKDDKGKSMLEYITQYTKNREEVEQLLRDHGAE
jgi:hypothetical protein